ncbi:hypothetical protein MRX96_039594 [Rhipicephalus microplus]
MVLVQESSQQKKPTLRMPLEDYPPDIQEQLKVCGLQSGSSTEFRKSAAMARLKKGYTAEGETVYRETRRSADCELDQIQYFQPAYVA